MSRDSRSRRLARQRSLRSAAAAEAAQRRAEINAGKNRGLSSFREDPIENRVYQIQSGQSGTALNKSGGVLGDQSQEALQRAYGVIDPPELLKEANEAAGVGTDPEKDQVNTPVFAADTKPTSGMGGVDKTILRYPYEHMNGTQDYINFSVFRYERGKVTNTVKEAGNDGLFSFGESGLTGGPILPKIF